MFNKRKNYIDNIRSFGVILVLLYHVFYIYNGIGVLGGIPTEKSVGIFDDLLTIVYPWMMILLFVVAGVSAKFSVEQRSKGEFLRERARKLLLPSTIGLFVIHWITGYLNMYFGGGLDDVPNFLIYPISVLAGQGHLWFAQLLFLYSVILGCFKKTIDKLHKLCESIGNITCLLFSIIIWLSAQILNMPIITVYRFGIYLVAFFIGYCAFSHDKVIEKIEKSRYISLTLSVIFGVLYFVLFRKMNYTEANVLKNIVTNLYAWCTVLTVFGFAKKYMDKENTFSRYLAANSYGYYILHYPILMLAAYLLHAVALNMVIKVLLTLVLELALTFAVNELLKRIPFVRYIVLGMKRRNNEIQIDS